MNPTRRPFSFLLLIFALAVFAGGSVLADDTEQEIPEPYRSFIPLAQKQVEQFPTAAIGTEAGQHQTFTVHLDEKPVAVGKTRFGCVRFVAPKEGKRDMVWAFSAPAEWREWYIMPASGKMTGFRDWLNADRLYDELTATVEQPARLQTHAAENFTPGATYILWFKTESEKPSASTVTGMINFLPPAEHWDAEAIEKGLGLKAAGAAKQVAYLNSRGGGVLLDGRFFKPGYAEARIKDMLISIRSFHQLAGGFTLETRITIPPCETEPPLADIEAAYGKADLVIPGKERVLFDETADKKDDAYYYDHFIFLVQKEGGKERVLSVTTQAADAALAKPAQGGLTWADAPMTETKFRIFYRDKKEIARLAFWGDSKAKLLSGELPKDTFQRPIGSTGARDELKYSGEGNWEERMVDDDGKTRFTASYKAHALDGTLREFFADGKPKTEAPYKNGQLDGVLKQWSPDGQSRELYFREGKRVEK